MTQEEHAQSKQQCKIAVVTGATGGMGREIAADLSRVRPGTQPSRPR